MSILSATGVSFEFKVPVLVIGAGACGLTAALAARGQGEEVLVLERDAKPSGSTALSSGMIPACDTRFQRARGIQDSPRNMAADIQKKARHRADPAVVQSVCEASGPAIEWLADEHGVNLHLVEGFLYPGHGVPRMHAPPSMTGQELMSGLLEAVGRT